MTTPPTQPAPTDSRIDQVLSALLGEELAALPRPPRMPRFASPLRRSETICSCGCGLRYDAHAWKCLAYVGIMDDGVDRLELRNCSCGSTIAIEAES